MPYKSLKLQNFRSYSDYSLELSNGVTIIIGPNGSGKTNLLEAIYVLSQGNSFRVGDKDLVRYGQESFRLEGQFGDQRRILHFQPDRQPAKQFSIDGLKRQRLTHSQKVPAVLFEPDELRLLSGSPARRRDYLDNLLARLWPDASKTKARFERALLQRNNMLKQSHLASPKVLEDQLFVWNIKLAEYAEQVLKSRLKLLDFANQYVAKSYSEIAQKPSEVRLYYQSELKTDGMDYKSQLLSALNSRLRQDMQRGYTTVGPHRDDFFALLNGAEAGISASRGEVRTLMLALKLVELQLMSQHIAPPLLLLDDVFSELDITRRAALANHANNYQTIITSTDVEAIKKYLGSETGVINMSFT